MSDRDRVRSAIDEILECVGRSSLKTLFFMPIEPDEYEEFLARLCCYVAPSFLPFASDDSGTLVTHLLPDRDLMESPVLYVPHDAQDARFMCDSFASLPAAIWLWICTYFTSEPEVLRQAIEMMGSKISNARPFPEELWSFLEQDPVRWSYRSESSNQAWTIANVNHPFAGMPQISYKTKPSEALTLLEKFLNERLDIPEVLSVFLAIRTKLNMPNSPKDVLKILSAEAWRDLEGYLSGMWRCKGRGICEWDSTLKYLPNPREVLSGTPFEILSDSPNTYGGEDQNGSCRLANVAREFGKADQPREELFQLRNSATLALITLGKYPVDLCDAISDSCEKISSDSLAAVVARESARVSVQGP